MPTAEELITTLQGVGVQFTQHSHGVVMTVEAQEAALAGSPGVVLKNLFIKDKKNRLYIVTALPNTNVDLNNLSMRLGVGKGALRFAPEELLSEMLQVPRGSVTPLAVASPGAKDVVLFLDMHIKALASDSVVFVHPLVNTMSLGLTPAALDAAVKALGRDPIYVDLEARCDAKSPDLAQHTVAPPLKEAAVAGALPAAASTSAPAAPGGPGAAATAPPKGAGTPEPGGGAGPGAARKALGPGGGKKGAAATKAGPSPYEKQLAASSVPKATQRMLELVAQALASTSGPACGSQGLSTRLDDYTLRRLTADLESQLSSVKNAAYALGYEAGKGEVVAYAQRKFA